MSRSRRITRVVVPLLVLVLLAGCVSAAGHRPTSRPPLVGVTIESRPDSAEVWVDGKFVGTTPMVQRLSPGVHAIAVTRDEYASWSRNLTVTADNPTRVMALLKPQRQQP